MCKGVWILGGGGHAKVVIATFESVGETITGVYDDDQTKEGAFLLGSRIVTPTPGESWWAEEMRHAFIAIGNNTIREKIAAIAAEWVVAQHANAGVHASVSVGEGSLICAGVVIQPDTSIGRHAIVNTSCSIDHDCVIDDFAHIGPGVTLAGGVSVGRRTFIGAGATIIPGVTLGADVTVGAGSVVLRDVAAGQTVAGVPAGEMGHE